MVVDTVQTQIYLSRGAIASIETGETAVVEAKTSTLKITPSKQGYRSFFVVNEEMTESIQVHFMNAGIMGANRMMSSSLGYELCKGLAM